MSVDIIAETLAKHRTTEVAEWGTWGIRVRRRYYRCLGCDWAGNPFPDGTDRAGRAAAANAEARRHEAEQVWEALQPGAYVDGELPSDPSPA